MKIDRPRAAVPWLPSRHRYAVFRLAAYLRLARTPACVPEPDRVLAIDRDQSSFETFAMTYLVLGTASAFLTHSLASRLLLPFAAIFGVALAAVGLTLYVVAVGLLVTPVLHAMGAPRGPSNIRIATTVFLITLFIPASYFATLTTWVAVAAWIFLSAIGMNAIAAGILFAMRSRVREAESRCAG